MLTDGLSARQIDVVNSISDNVEIIACAGAGKTSVVTRRIVNILKQNSSIQPCNIVAFTFTKKAAEELKSRIYRIALSELGHTNRICRNVYRYDSWLLPSNASGEHSRISELYCSR